MFVNYVGLLIINILGSITLSSGQTCSPISSPPASIAPPGGDVPSQAQGDWFAYRQTGAVTTNQRIQLKSFGPTVEPNTNDTTTNAVIQYMQIAWSSNGACQNEYWTGYYDVYGFQTGNDAVSADNYTTIKFISYSVLYHDYQKIMIGYGCAAPSKDLTCANPQIWVQTRTRPDKLSASEMDTFDSIINKALQGTCLSVQNMPKQIYNDNQPNCPLIDPPACIANLIKGMEVSVPSSSGQTTTVNPAGYGSSTATSGCKWPSNIDRSKNVKRDPPRTEGVWYVYRAAFGPEPTSVGMRYYWHMVNDGILTAINLTLPGSFAWAEFTQYDAPSDTQCNFGYWTGLLANAGDNIGVRFVTTDPGVPLYSLTIHQDDKYQFFYGCFKPNLQTGTCDIPFAMVSSRTTPADWTQSEKDTVDNTIITPLFKEYGCSASDLPAMAHPKDKPECNFQGSISCLDAYIAGFKQQAVQTKPAY